MATKKTSTTPQEFVEAEEAVVAEETPETKEVVAPGAPATKKARIKGTWTMHWGSQIFEFEDGKTYTIPADLYAHLQGYGNIYDTL